MKETIEYNYNICIDKLIEDNNLFSFYYNNELYLFVFYNRDIKEINDILSCTREVNQKSIKTLQFIINKNGNILTEVNQKYYVLLKCFDGINKKVDILEMLNNKNKLFLSEKSSSLYRNNWAKLWSNKIDYFEYQIREIGKDKKIVLDSFSYYIGLANNAIELVNHTLKMPYTIQDKITLSHRRIYYPNYKLNYYNPLSSIFDLEIRDFAEYIKAYFFAGEDAFLELITFLKSKRLTIYSYQMFLARLIYPSYYFDLYEKIMNDNLDQNILIDIIDKSEDYELFIKKTYLEILKYANVEKIDWIIKLEEH